MTSNGECLWLTSEQQLIWRDYLAGVSRINDRLDAELRPFGLDLGEYEILVNLSEADHLEMRMSELAQCVRQSRSRLTHTVARMEAKGLILRKSCQGDRRGVIAVLTATGLNLLQTAAPCHVASVRAALVDVVTADDFEALGRAMKAVVEVAD
ncbi:MarR family winged helix-turn-helix transcriptional regulator [Micropruina sp.]|uniref:MarR family winged helix-turn-helix transcriptional regulator n=1 Tax=Micropruina sp. TaxID=2737536 RepID=UPI0039E2C2E0